MPRARWGLQLDVENFEAYHRLYGGVADLSRIGAGFSARLNVIRLPRLVLHERRVEGVLSNRTWACVGRHGFDHITLHLLRSGDFVSGPPGAERRLQPGEVVVLDTSRPHVSRMTTRADLLTIQVARAHVAEVISDPAGIHGTVLPAAACGLLTDFLASLTRRSASLQPDPSAHVAAAAINLLSLGLKGLPASAEALPAEAGDALRRRRAEAFIATRLPDPNLDAHAVADGIGISRSVLYRVFGVDGGVRRFIQQRRLDELRRALLRPGETRRLGSLAYAHGFATESHCSRAFAAAFGLPPGQFRTELTRPDADEAIDREDSLIGLARALY
ncbi:helix-turn-helix domain-containing protein [Methylobacterium sp. E-016]|uniref:helix-turn-helix domain-containing protein n=1 Tax=Methylobacterium sp. E-016 TaxID=2836556 RepID=UPI001FB9147A|nr:helix-turn-helix domain-containing protein [Methylobacterium sp. E-016]